MKKEEAKKQGPSGGNHQTYKPQTKMNYKSDISNLENFVFKYGLAKHAAQYVESKKRLQTTSKKSIQKEVQTQQKPSVQVNSLS